MEEKHMTVGLFKEWTLLYNKTYSHDQEWSQRFKTFVENVDRINELNKRPARSFDPPRFGLNQFADLSLDEFKDKILMPGRKVYPSARQPNITSRAPASFDWTNKDGVVTSVKDQGQAGTCWAFSGVGNLEGLWTLKSGSPSPSLSTESLNDCDGLHDGRTGAVACGPLGGLMQAVYQFVKEQGGIMTEKDYPYCVGSDECRPCQPANYSEKVCRAPWPINPCRAKDSCDAKYDRSKFVPGLKVKDYVRFPTENILVDKLVEIGPLSASLDASDMQFYRGGILVPWDCDSTHLNHAVLIVGYNDSSTEPYWRSKNSWGADWGEKGFFRIQKGINACGIGSGVLSAVLE